MRPTAADPARGAFVSDQVAALRRRSELEVELFAFRSRGASSYGRALRDVRRRYGSTRFDVVHAHFGLTIWPSLALRAPCHAVTLHGTDLVHPRSRAITTLGLPLMDLVAPVSEPLAALVARRAVRGRLEVLPCGVDVTRFVPIERREARRALGLDPAGPYLLFGADPARPEKRHDRARAVAGERPLLTLGHVPPGDVPLWVNAADAVLVTSERESFGLVVLEALACDVPVLSTPVGVAPTVLRGVPGAHCGPFDVPTWRARLDELLAAGSPRIPGRAAAERWSSDAMAGRVEAAWRAVA